MNNNYIFKEDEKIYNKIKLYGLWVQYSFYLNIFDQKFLGVIVFEVDDVIFIFKSFRKIFSVIFGVCI